MANWTRKMPSNMTHDFSVVPHANIPRSNFNRSHAIKTAFDGGFLIPLWVDESLPGDTFTMDVNAICRLATPLVPFMDNLWLDFFFFSVPNRLLWVNWEKFMGYQEDPGDSIDYTIPQLVSSAGGFTEESVMDYMGLPTGIHPLSVSALPFRAWNLIYNEWFRDQNLEDSLSVNTDNGPDGQNTYPLRRRGKRHDYFTSCLPWPQKFQTEVEMPLGTSAPVKADATRGTADAIGVLDTSDTSSKFIVNGTEIRLEGAIANEDLYADLTEATAANINEIREAVYLQQLLERDARGGTRYTEVIKSHFRVDHPDQQWRPEYLGGGTVPITISPVPQTSESGTTKQGHLAAVGYGSATGIRWTKSFTEHCTLIGLCSVRADLTYQQGIARMWKRSTRYDFYWPSMAFLGEQEVLDGEIFADGTSADADTFGYNERWSEYRYALSKITGKLRSDATSSLDKWHLSQDFASLPVLNYSFIRETPPISRVVAVTSEPEFVFDGYLRLMCTRPMPTFSVPGMVARF